MSNNLLASLDFKILDEKIWLAHCEEVPRRSGVTNLMFLFVSIEDHTSNQMVLNSKVV